MNKVFSKLWFEENQDKLLWFANTRFGKSILGIEDKDAIIEYITPNSYHIRVYENNYIAKFHIRSRYANNLKKNLKYVWKAFHWFDEHIADKYNPKWNLGFPTYSDSPDAGDAVGNTADGRFRRFVSGGEDWDTYQAATTASTIAMTGTLADVVMGTPSSPSGNWRDLRRTGMTFDTSSIGASATINEVAGSNISIEGTNIVNSFVGVIEPLLSLGFSSFSPASNNTFVTSDFGSMGSVVLTETTDQAAYNASGQNVYELNSSGTAYINTTGITGFAAREATYDIPDVEPVWESNEIVAFTFQSADNATPPVLNLDYDLISTTRRKVYIID